jgi:hypothetical protein
MTINEWVYSTDVVSLLSLDIARPFFERMGLNICDPDILQNGLRALTKERPAAFRDEVGDHLAALSEGLFDYVEVDFGRPVAERLRLWVSENLFPENSRNYWFFYESSFSAWSSRLRHGKGDPLQFGHKTESLLWEYRNATDMSDVHSDIRVVKGQPRSMWDAAIYSLMKYDDDEEAVRQANESSSVPVSRYPFGPITDAIERHRFQVFWEKALTILDDSDFARVKSSSEAFWKVPLPAPRSLRYWEWPSVKPGVKPGGGEKGSA